MTLLAAPLPAAAAEPAAPQATQWATADTAPEGSTVRELQGVADGAGNCIYDIKLALAPNQDAIWGQQISDDPSRCVAEVAELQGQAAIDAIKEYESKIRDGASQTGTGTTPAAGQATSGSTQSEGPEIGVQSHYINSQGHLRTLWEEPVDLTVAEVTNHVNWSWNNYNCLRPGWGNYRYFWRPGTGWRLLQNNFRNYYWCDRQESSSYARYRNGRFCFSVDTYADFDRNWIFGYWDGYLKGRSRTWVSGGCKGLLRFEYHFVRDKN